MSSSSALALPLPLPFGTSLPLPFFLGASESESLSESMLSSLSTFFAFLAFFAFSFLPAFFLSIGELFSSFDRSGIPSSESESLSDESLRSMTSSLRLFAGGAALLPRSFAARHAAWTSADEGMNAEALKTLFGRRSCIFLHFGPV